MEIYADGRLLTVLNGGHIRKFEVELAKEGKTQITVVAGDQSDEAVFLYRAGSEAEYAFAQKDSEISNWNSARAMDLIRYPDGMLTFHDSVHTIIRYREGENF